MNTHKTPIDALSIELTDQELENINLVELIHQPEWKTILFEIIKREKIDIWNIDVSLLAEKYLEKIQSMQSLSLKVPANAMLACALLVKFKSKHLKISSLEPDPDEITEQQKLELNEILPDLTSTAKIREGVITLDELVGSIEEIIKKTKKPSVKKNLIDSTPDFNIHISEEDIEKNLAGVFDKIKSRVDSEGLTTFTDLVDDLNSLELVKTFLSLLFLMNQNKIRIWQEKFFSEIFISLIVEEKKESMGVGA